ncbi:MAG: hypothetical protein LAT78_13265 [Roseinatronobacter sp.]|jgi:hypothetical protein|nr:hypothetical protein [Roseinatronobacter sp.]
MEKAKRIILVCVATAILANCGTIGGIANGTGEVLEGVASDMRGVGGIVAR